MAAHGVFLIAPMPETTESAITLESAEQESNAELSVVVLSKQSPTPEKTAPPSAEVNSVSSQTIASKPEPSPNASEPLLQADIIPDQSIAEPVPFEDLPITESVPPEEPTVVEDPEVSLEAESLEAEVDANSEFEKSLPDLPPAGPLMSYGDTFPHFQGAVEGCFGFNQCRRVSGAGSYRSVARSLISDLEAQGYDVDLRDDLEDTGRNVYELMPPGGDAIQYLLVFSDSDGSAVYVISDTIMTLNDLQALQAQTQQSRQSS